MSLQGHIMDLVGSLPLPASCMTNSGKVNKNLRQVLTRSYNWRYKVLARSFSGPCRDLARQFHDLVGTLLAFFNDLVGTLPAKPFISILYM